MSDDQAGFGVPSWLPPRLQRQLASLEAADALEARRAEHEREDRQEAAEERALQAYRQAAEMRGDVVSAVELATGQGTGRTLDEIFGDAIAHADREDARAAAREHRDDREVLVGRSDGWPGSEFELDRMIARWEEGRDWILRYAVRHNYPAALASASAKMPGGPEATRSQAWPELTRTTENAFIR